MDAQHIKQILLNGAGPAGERTVQFRSAQRAQTIRREIYRFRAELNRTDPTSDLAAAANSLVFSVYNESLLIRDKHTSSVSSDLATAAGTLAE